MGSRIGRVINGAIRQLYLFDEMRNLMREAIEVPALFTVVDPLTDVNLAYMGDGDQHGWHFDNNDFVAVFQVDDKPAEAADRLIDRRQLELPEEVIDASQLIMP